MTRSLLEELKQSRPFTLPAQEASLSVIRTAEVIRRRLAGILGPYNLTLPQYNVLRILRGAHPQVLPTLEIVDRMLLKEAGAPGITRLLDALETKRLIQRKRIRKDRRMVVCRITEEGLRILEELDPIDLATHSALMSPLTQDEVQNLIDLLGKIRSGGSATRKTLPV
jgi:DNA-binding MarR family transcriptional regulator